MCLDESTVVPLNIQISQASAATNMKWDVIFYFSFFCSSFQSQNATVKEKELLQESSTVAGKPRDAAAVLFGLNFADNIHYKFKSIVKLQKPGFRAPNIPAQNRI